MPEDAESVGSAVCRATYTLALPPPEESWQIPARLVALNNKFRIAVSQVFDLASVI
jgi:hypothetical protein